VKTSKPGLDLIKGFEGLRLTAYYDVVGVLTIGYGHTGDDVYEGLTITELQAEQLLQKDLARFEQAVNKLITVPLNQNQFDALVSFTYNVGEGALEESTLRKRLNSGEKPNIAASQELPRWAKGGNGEVIEGLARRRGAEVDLFCKPVSVQPAVKLSDVTSLQQTWFKKEPKPISELSNDLKAKVYQGRTYPVNQILEKRDGHTLLELGFKLGKWWVYDDHWSGLTPKINPYAQDGNLRYLRDFPFFDQKDNGPEGWRQCQTSSLAMCLKYLKVKGINDDTDYLKIVNQYGDTTTRDAHYGALSSLKVNAKFYTNLDPQDIKQQINKGKPVAVGILHHGSVSAPNGGGHFIVITGYSDSYWLVQDPYGDLDLINGVWENQAPGAGRNKHYSFKNLDPRLFYGGGASGWGWIFK